MRFATALLTASLPLATSGQTQLLPTGEFSARDGRPGGGLTWKIDDTQGRRIAAQMNAVAALTPIVIDYEHQTLLAAKNGQPAPASGWLDGGKVTWLDGKGLYGDVRWTKRAAEAIDAGEYAYISPVIAYDKATGAVQSVQMAALTNFPALLGMEPAVAALTALNHEDPQEPDMKLLLAALSTYLGVAALQDEAGAIAALQAHQAKPAPLSTALTAALGLQANADETAALSAVQALKAAENTASTATAAMASMQAELATLTAKINGAELTGTVEKAIADGKLLPAQRDWALQLGKTNLAALTAFIASAPVIGALGGQTGGKAPGGDGTATDALTGDVMRAFGLTPEQFAKAAPKQA